MKTRHYIVMAVAVVAAFVAGLMTGRNGAEPAGPVTLESETRVDTMARREPAALSSETTGSRAYRARRARIADAGAPENAGSTQSSQSTQSSLMEGAGTQEGADSVTVELPIVSRHYGDSTYEAWVSGPVDPRLDSVRIFAPTTVITRREWKPPKHWHIGVTAGYGYGAKGFQPYIGVGITYSIFSF